MLKVWARVFINDVAVAGDDYRLADDGGWAGAWARSITFSHHWYFHFDNDFHKTPICAWVSCMLKACYWLRPLTFPPHPPFRCCLRQRNNSCCCLGHVCLDSCKDNTLLDLCVCVFDKWWRRFRSPNLPLPAFATVSLVCVFFFMFAFAAATPIVAAAAAAVASLRFFVDTYSHCFSQYPCTAPPPHHHSPSCHALAWALFLHPATSQALDTCSFYLLPAPSPEPWNWGWLSVLPASIWLNIDIDFDLMFSPVHTYALYEYVCSFKGKYTISLFISIIFRPAQQLGS